MSAITNQSTVTNVMAATDSQLRTAVRTGTQNQMKWAMAELRRRRESFNYGAERVIRQRGQELYA